MVVAYKKLGPVACFKGTSTLIHLNNVLNLASCSIHKHNFTIVPHSKVRCWELEFSWLALHRDLITCVLISCADPSAPKPEILGVQEDHTPIMENQMEKNMEHEMETLGPFERGI